MGRNVWPLGDKRSAGLAASLEKGFWLKKEPVQGRYRADREQIQGRYRADKEQAERIQSEYSGYRGKYRANRADREQIQGRYRANRRASREHLQEDQAKNR